MYEFVYILTIQWWCFESAADLPPIFLAGTLLLSMAVRSELQCTVSSRQFLLNNVHGRARSHKRSFCTVMLAEYKFAKQMYSWSGIIFRTL
jgi:hypothetical protein